VVTMTMTMTMMMTMMMMMNLCPQRSAAEEKEPQKKS